MTDIQGFLATIELDGQDITAYLSDASLDRQKTVETKPTMDGTGVPLKLMTQKDGTLTLNGQVDTAGQQILETIFAKDTSVEFNAEMGDGVGIAAGDYSGEVMLSGETISTSASDTWNFSLAAEGWLDYTAPTP